MIDNKTSELTWDSICLRVVGKMASFGNHSGQNEIVNTIGRMIYPILEDADNQIADRDTRIASLEAGNGELKKVIAEMTDLLKEREWINVDDRLPEEHEDIMVSVGRGVLNGESVEYQSETSFYNGKFEIEENDSIVSPVTHWQPLLPSPPITEKDNG